MYLKQNAKTAFRMIKDEAVIVDLSASKLYSLNPIATIIWKMSDGKTTINEIVDKMEEEYEVERETAEKDCMEFVNDFVGKGLLSINEELMEE